MNHPNQNSNYIHWLSVLVLIYSFIYTSCIYISLCYHITQSYLNTKRGNDILPYPIIVSQSVHPAQFSLSLFLLLDRIPFFLLPLLHSLHLRSVLILGLYLFIKYIICGPLLGCRIWGSVDNRLLTDRSAIILDLHILHI